LKSSFDVGVFLFPDAYHIPLRVLSVTPANDGQLEDQLDIDIPQQVGDVARQDRLHDPIHIDVANAAYRGLVGYHPPPLHVSNFHPRGTGSLLDEFLGK